MPSDPITFFVHGLARPGGSKRGFIIRAKGRPDRVAMADASGASGKTWRQDVKHAAFCAMAGREPLAGPLFLSVRFVMPRPAGHYGSGRNAGVLKDGAPLWPITRPDATKLIRSLEDACTGILWLDDSQVVMQAVGKEYGHAKDMGAHVSVQPMTEEIRARAPRSLFDPTPPEAPQSAAPASAS